MRLREQIPVVLDRIDIAQFLKDINYPIDCESQTMKNISSDFLIEKDVIKKVWFKNKNLRLVQVLIIVGILEDLEGDWFYKNEIDYLIDKEIVKFEDITFYGINVEIEGVINSEIIKIKSVQFITLSSLTIEHIRSIIKSYADSFEMSYENIPLKYLKYFNERIKKEGEDRSFRLLNELFEEK